MKWIIFIYKVPSKPTKYRAYLWREIKRFGGLYLQDGVCIFPDKDDVHLFVGALGENVHKFGGQENTFLSTTFSKEKELAMIEQFNAARNEEYSDMLPDIRRMEEYFEEEESWEFSDKQISKIRSEFQKLLRLSQAIEARDYFEAEKGREVRLLLDKCRRQLHRF